MAKIYVEAEIDCLGNIVGIDFFDKIRIWAIYGQIKRWIPRNVKRCIKLEEKRLKLRIRNTNYIVVTKPINL